MSCHVINSQSTVIWRICRRGCALCVHQTILHLVTVRAVLDIFSLLGVTIKTTSSSVLLIDPHYPCYSVILIIRVTQ